MLNGNILGTGPTLPVNISLSILIYASLECSVLVILSDSLVIIVNACFDLDLTSTQASCLGDDASLTCSPDHFIAFMGL